jgi:hypothetical protein
MEVSCVGCCGSDSDEDSWMPLKRALANSRVRKRALLVTDTALPHTVVPAQSEC